MAYKNKNIVKDGSFFTHFASLPLRQPHQRDKILQLQQALRQKLHSCPQYNSPDLLREHSHKLSHVTLFKLTLRHTSAQQKLSNILSHFQQQINDVLIKFPLQVRGIGYFTRINKNAKCKEVTVVYLELAEHIGEALTNLTDRLVRALLKEDIMAPQQLRDMNVVYDHNRNLYRPENLHISLFRASGLFQSEKLQEIMKELEEFSREIRFQWNSFDISTMKQYDQDQFYLPLIRFSVGKQEKEAK